MDCFKDKLHQLCVFAGKVWLMELLYQSNMPLLLMTPASTPFLGKYNAALNLL